MFVESIIQDKLESLVGFRNDTLPDFTLSPENSKSESGLFFNSSLVTLKNIYYTAQLPEMDDTKFNEYLTNMKRDAIVEMVSNLLECKGDFKGNIGWTYDAFDSDVKKITPEQDMFRGLEIEMFGNSILRLNEINIYSYEDATVTLKLYNTNYKEALFEQELELEAHNTVSVQLGWLLQNVFGGKYYLVISDNDYTGDMFSFNAEIPIRYQSTISPVKFKTFDDITHVSKSGFALDISTYIDWTDFIIRNRNQFATLLVKAVGILVLKQILNSTRSNSFERLTGELKALAYEGLTGKESDHGLEISYKKLLKQKQREVFNSPRIYKSTLG